MRTDINNHPVESILRLIRNEGIKADMTVCPGDFTNKSDVQGFISGWDFSLEISRELKSNEIVATLGNHDVDAYDSFSNYSLDIAKGIRKGFPIGNEQECDTFWSKGCVFLERQGFRILVLNSSHYHHNRISAGKGKVGKDLIDYVDQYMTKNGNNKISIALAHHHPVNHSRLDLGEDDIIINGSDLVEVLGKHEFDLFIHGHKHDPFLRYYNCLENNNRLPIFSSGSFSATTNLSWTSQRNTFHTIQIFKDEKRCNGSIKTWTFIPKRGWQVNNDDNGFHANTGFGFRGEITDLKSKISSIVGKRKIVDWKDVIEKIPDIKFLIPSESIALEEMLKKDKLLLSGKLSENPDIISNVKIEK
ncbi:metallophosphoesterase [Arenibacter sp. BSSL-BM3]|uniref:Metallophosphoesterase n=1 Tax=Arenibacter arenosicollis TaxID=2762274 RepID=A0ABR7QLC2_9FLAO|nr:metallophosphoesterase [Arenibacter arenosicollis]MBC8767730.1 metallophosphoesterase [Arenibacter arenosicollis]